MWWQSHSKRISKNTNNVILSGGEETMILSEKPEDDSENVKLGEYNAMTEGVGTGVKVKLLRKILIPPEVVDRQEMGDLREVGFDVRRSEYGIDLSKPIARISKYAGNLEHRSGVSMISIFQLFD